MGILHIKKANKRTFERLKMATFRLRAYVWVGREKIPLQGFVFVADFSELSVGIYLEKNIKITTPVLISFESSEGTPFKGKIAWCNRYSLGQKFLGHESLSHRAGVQFSFANEQERQRYFDYLIEIKSRVKILSGTDATPSETTLNAAHVATLPILNKIY